MSWIGFSRSFLLLVGFEMLFVELGLSSEVALLRNGRSLLAEAHELVGNRVVLVLDGTDRLEVDQQWIESITPVALPAPEQNTRAQLFTPTTSRRYEPGEIKRIIKSAAQKNQLAEGLLSSIIRVESNFNPAARSLRGAQGLMQLMPETIALYRVKDIFDVKENVEAGARYFKDLLQQFNQDLVLALAAYNAGPSAVINYKGVPPFPETQNYIRRVLDNRN
jgi:soluble lytic murein transglycosylase-like protein